MIRYILKRLLQIIPVLLCVAAVIFTIMYFAPGDPVYIILGENITPESYAAKAAELGLDKPFFEQLLIFRHELHPQDRHPHGAARPPAADGDHRRRLLPASGAHRDPAGHHGGDPPERRCG